MNKCALTTLSTSCSIGSEVVLENAWGRLPFPNSRQIFANNYYILIWHCDIIQWHWSPIQSLPLQITWDNKLNEDEHLNDIVD